MATVALAEQILAAPVAAALKIQAMETATQAVTLMVEQAALEL
jgi:hypothetical protein